METYSTAELLKVAGLSETNFRAFVARGHFVPSRGRPGRGYILEHTRTDVLQARLLVRLGRAGVPPHRAAMFWPLVEKAIDRPRTFLILAHRDDGSDTDFRVVRDGEDGGWEDADAPGVATIINIRGLLLEVAARLMALRGAA